MAFGWTGATIALASVAGQAEEFMVAFDGRALRASQAAPGRPWAGKGEEGPILGQREPYRRLARLGVRVLAK
jgi:hypothetical protein